MACHRRKFDPVAERNLETRPPVTLAVPKTSTLSSLKMNPERQVCEFATLAVLREPSSLSHNQRQLTRPDRDPVFAFSSVFPCDGCRVEIANHNTPGWALR